MGHFGVGLIGRLGLGLRKCEDGGGKPELGRSGHVLPHCKRGMPLLVVKGRFVRGVVDMRCGCDVRKGKYPRFGIPDSFGPPNCIGAR